VCNNFSPKIIEHIMTNGWAVRHYTLVISVQFISVMLLCTQLKTLLNHCMSTEICNSNIVITIVIISICYMFLNLVLSYSLSILFGRLIFLCFRKCFSFFFLCFLFLFLYLFFNIHFLTLCFNVASFNVCFYLGFILGNGEINLPSCTHHITRLVYCMLLTIGLFGK